MPTPPINWFFNDADRQAYETRFYWCPTRLVIAGRWAELWRVPGTTRGGGTVTSLLPVLALHTWPDRLGAETGWTGWTYVSRRRLATFAGLNKDSVRAACQRLVSLNLMELNGGRGKDMTGATRRITGWQPPSTRKGMNRMLWCREICSAAGHGRLSPAFRHLYLVIADLDPIGDEAAYQGVGEQWNREPA